MLPKCPSLRMGCFRTPNRPKTWFSKERPHTNRMPNDVLFPWSLVSPLSPPFSPARHVASKSDLECQTCVGIGLKTRVSKSDSQPLGMSTTPRPPPKKLVPRPRGASKCNTRRCTNIQCDPKQRPDVCASSPCPLVHSTTTEQQSLVTLHTSSEATQGHMAPFALQGKGKGKIRKINQS